MAFTYDVSTDRGKVRLLCTDVIESNAIFQDAEIDAFLSMNTSVRLAAAAALEVIASNEVLVLKKIINLDLETDGPAVARELREQAKQLRAQETAVGAFDIAEQIHDTFTEREYWLKQVQRDAI
ncbi:MAG: hypothetical protein IPK75_18360 [Acidobacteria bacterium]|nr:hypothetical protein [Acidobacteriota bacterium]